MRKFCTTVLVGVSLTGLATGCGSSSTTTNDNVTTPATAPRSGASNLNGSYVRTVSKADMARTNSFRGACVATTRCRSESSARKISSRSKVRASRLAPQ